MVARTISSEALNRMIFVHDVPDFDDVRFLFGKLAHELPCLLGSIDLHNRRIAEIEFPRETLEISGPATATRGAFAVAFEVFRTSKFPKGPPTSTTEVIPLRR